MTLLDLLIIYLACGAPFAIHYFLQNHVSDHSKLFWLKTLFIFLVWIPSALLLLRQNKTFETSSVFNFDKSAAPDSNREKFLQSIKKQIEKISLAGNLKISIYELREILERYIGLTLAAQTEDEKIREQETAIFRVSEIKNVELGAICLKRRNRKRLSIHQTEARIDFLNLIKLLLESGAEGNNIERPVIELTRFLKDSEARIELEKIFAGYLQTCETIRVQRLEKNLWKPELHKPLSAKRTSTGLPSLTTANSLRKD